MHTNQAIISNLLQSITVDDYFRTRFRICLNFEFLNIRLQALQPSRLFAADAESIPFDDVDNFIEKYIPSIVKYRSNLGYIWSSNIYSDFAKYHFSAGGA